MIDKKEIEKAKIRLKVLIKDECKCPECLKNKKAYKTFLQYITQLEQENNKQSKIIDKMALEIAFYDNYETFCKEVYPNNSCEGNGIPCWDCVKQYFEKKVEGK